MAFSDAEIIEEQTHFANVISTFNSYAPYSLAANNRRRKDFYTLLTSDQELLKKLGYKDRLNKVDDAILINAQFLDDVVEDPEIFGHNLKQHDDQVKLYEDSSLNPEALHESPAEHLHSHGGRDKTSRQPTEFDVDKLRSTLKQIVRDWSEEGKVERDACYEPIKEALTRHFANTPEEDRRNVQVLVPGTGLGRLSYEVARLGFTCQGNEFSHYMLLVSHFVLNRTRTINQYVIYPYIHSFSNIPHEPALLRSVSIPDILPSDLPSESKFSLVAGDFEEIYGVTDEDDHSGRWNAILTCFFIDTAKNIINYLKIFHKILASGGVWINLGPLLWHWENNTTNDTSIELDLEQVKQLAREIGFEISNERTIDTTYTNNGQSMLGYVYHASFWVAIKK